jgi:hypothetical protein
VDTVFGECQTQLFVIMNTIVSPWVLPGSQRIQKEVNLEHLIYLKLAVIWNEFTFAIIVLLSYLQGLRKL